MIDLTVESPLSIAEAAARVPSFRPGKKTHVATIFRWIQHGVRGVKLEAVRLGGRWVTSAEALQRFAEACSAASAPDAAPPARPIPAARRLSAERADRELAEMGI
jgi:hypothetical protein